MRTFEYCQDNETFMVTLSILRIYQLSPLEMLIGIGMCACIRRDEQGQELGILVGGGNKHGRHIVIITIRLSTNL